MMNIAPIKKIVEDGKVKGVLGFIKDIILYGFMTLITVVVLNPDIIYENIKKQQEREHSARIERRLEVDPTVRNLLRQCVSELDCDRAFVCEFHNGTNNFVGLPFLYADMKYEEVADGVLNVDIEYSNFNLTRYEFVPYGLKHGYWEGTTDEIEVIDKRFAGHLRIDGTGYSSYIAISGVDEKIGILGVSYSTSNISLAQKAIIKRKLIEVSQKLGILLSPVVN